jgi:hypothetical protein
MTGSPPLRASSRRASLRRIFGLPLALAAVTLCGLVAALIGDGAWDHGSTLVLLVPLAVIGWKVVVAWRRA